VCFQGRVVYNITGDYPAPSFFNITKNGQIKIAANLKSDNLKSTSYIVSAPSCCLCILTYGLLPHELVPHSIVTYILFPLGIDTLWAFTNVLYPKGYHASLLVQFTNIT